MWPVAVLAGVVILLYRELTASKPIPVFVSYDHSEDARYRHLLDAWSKNPKFRFCFDRRSPGMAIDSSDAGTIKGVLCRQMKESKCLLVLVGEKTKESKWVRWEIQRARQQDVSIPVIGVKLKPHFGSPPELLGAKTIWAKEFTEEAILTALEQVRNTMQ